MSRSVYTVGGYISRSVYTVGGYMSRSVYTVDGYMSSSVYTEGEYMSSSVYTVDGCLAADPSLISIIYTNMVSYLNSCLNLSFLYKRVCTPEDHLLSTYMQNITIVF